MANGWGNNRNRERLYFFGLQNHYRCWLQQRNLKRHLFLGRKAMTNLNSILKSRDVTFLTKVHLVKAMVFPVVMYRSENCTKEGRAPKNWYFQAVMLEKTLESPLDYKKIQPVHPKGYQSWVFMEGLMLKLTLQYFDHLMQGVDSLEKTLMLG